jgi:hypothetical protein
MMQGNGLTSNNQIVIISQCRLAYQYLIPKTCKLIFFATYKLIFFKFVRNLSKESSRANSREGAVGQCLLSALSAGNTVGKRKLDSGLGELHTAGTLEVLGTNSCCSDDLNGTRTSAVATSHLVIQLGDGTSQGNIPELSVHIVSTTSRGVTKPDSVILDNARILLNNFDNIQDLTSSLLHLVKLMKVIPKFGLGDDLVGGEDDHPVGFRVGVINGGSLAADHLILAHESSNSHSEVTKTRDDVRTSFFELAEESNNLELTRKQQRHHQQKEARASQNITIRFQLSTTPH